MQRLKDKYGRGSAAANGAEFVDLEPGEGGETMEINEDAESERTPRGAISEDLNSAPFQNLASQLANRIAYYVGDVKIGRNRRLLRRRSSSLSNLRRVRFLK